MPFRSKAQSAACFATGGFGGKVDCKEFAGHTDYKHLPKKVKGFKEWLQENHSEFLDEAWYDPGTWGPAIKSGLRTAGTAAALTAAGMGGMGGMAHGATAPEAGGYVTLQKQDQSRFYPYSWHSGKPGQPGIERPDWDLAKKN